MSSRHVRFAIVADHRKGGSLHHWNATDGAEDFDGSPNVGSDGDISVVLHTFRGGLRGKPFKSDGLDTSCIVPTVIGSMGLLFYDVDGKLVLVGQAHVSPAKGITWHWKDDRFAMVLERWEREVSQRHREMTAMLDAERKGPMAAPTRAQKRRAA